MNKEQTPLYREITQEQLTAGYLVFNKDLPITSPLAVRHDYVVVKKTKHGTYIVKEPENMMNKEQKPPYREITAAQLQAGYVRLEGNPLLQVPLAVRHDYCVIMKTDCGTYIVKEPEHK